MQKESKSVASRPNKEGKKGIYFVEKKEIMLKFVWLFVILGDFKILDYSLFFHVFPF